MEGYLHENWRKGLQSFTMRTNLKQKFQFPIFLHVVGEDARAVRRQYVSYLEEEIQRVLRTMKEIDIPATSVSLHGHVEETKTIDAFTTGLKYKAMNCEFPTFNDSIIVMAPQ